MNAAERFAAVDAADPMPSWNELAASVGIDPPMLAPGDYPMDLNVELDMYWPVVPPALQESR